MMTKKELMKALEKAFDGQVKVYSTSDYHIDCDVSTRFTKDDWKERIAGLGMTDNSKSIPNSWKYGKIVVVLFYGACKIFNGGKINLNFN